MNGGIVVVTVTRDGYVTVQRCIRRNAGIAVAVVVNVLIPFAFAAFVYDTVTIVVHTVADFGCIRIDGGIAVIAIQKIGNITGRLGTGHRGDVGITVAVTVTVLIPDGTVFVH